MIISACALFVGACGAGSSSGSDPSTPPVVSPPTSPSPQPVAGWQTYFQQSGVAFPDLDAHVAAMGGTVFMTVAPVLDINRDGKEDLVLHLKKRSDDTRFLNKDATPNRLLIFTATADGSFRDATSDILGVPFGDLGGANSRQHALADLNGDGYLDVVFALNREDGRACGEIILGCSNWFAQNAALVSGSDGKYNILTFGENSYHHGIGIGRDLQGAAVIATTNRELYRFANGSFDLISRDVESGFTNTFASSPNRTWSDFLLTDARQYDRTNSRFEPPFLNLYRFNSASSRFEITSTLSQIPAGFVSIGGSTEKRYYSNIDGRDVVDSQYYNSCRIKLTPSGNDLIVASQNGAQVRGGVNGRTSVPESDLTAHVNYQLLDLSTAPLRSSNALREAGGAYNVNFMFCGDVNEDGYDDFVTYPYRSGAKPIVLLNNKASSFVKVSDDRFPAGPSAQQFTSVFIDFTGDKRKDLVYFPGNGCSTGTPCQISSYRSLKPLD